MTAIHTRTKPPCDLQAPKRNHYFHGKQLDVYHFELETEYLNFKRRTLNRLIAGYGVVCGLDVRIDPECDDAIIVCPGFAIDRAGNEIFVPEQTEPYKIRSHPDAASTDEEQSGASGSHVHVVLCYHECLAEPVPVRAGDCCHEEPCQPGVIRERFKVDFRPGCAETAGPELLIEDVISDCKLDYNALVKIVSRECECCPEDPCIPLANIRVEAGPGGRCCCRDIDITVRPIVYNNDLLFQLLLSMRYEENRRYRAK